MKSIAPEICFPIEYFPRIIKLTSVEPTPKPYPPIIVWRTVLPREMLPMKNGAATHHTIQYAQ